MKNYHDNQVSQSDVNENVVMQAVGDNQAASAARCSSLSSIMQTMIPPISPSDMKDYHSHHVSAEISSQSNHHIMNPTTYRHLVPHQTGSSLELASKDVLRPEKFGSVSPSSNNPWMSTQYQSSQNIERKSGLEAKCLQLIEERKNKEKFSLNEKVLFEQNLTTGKELKTSQNTQKAHERGKEECRILREHLEKQLLLSSRNLASAHEQFVKSSESRQNKNMDLKKEERVLDTNDVQASQWLSSQQRKKIIRQPLQYAMSKSEGQTNLQAKEMPYAKSNTPMQSVDKPETLIRKVTTPVSCTKPCGSQSNTEASFSIYGYKPFSHTYITPAQLKAREESLNRGTDLATSRMLGTTASVQSSLSATDASRITSSMLPTVTQKQQILVNTSVKSISNQLQFQPLNENEVKKQLSSTNQDFSATAMPHKQSAISQSTVKDHEYHTSQKPDESSCHSLSTTISASGDNHLHPSCSEIDSNKLSQSCSASDSSVTSVVSHSNGRPDLTKDCIETQPTSLTNETTPHPPTDTSFDSNSQIIISEPENMERLATDISKETTTITTTSTTTTTITISSTTSSGVGTTTATTVITSAATIVSTTCGLEKQINSVQLQSSETTDSTLAKSIDNKTNSTSCAIATYQKEKVMKRKLDNKEESQKRPKPEEPINKSLLSLTPYTACTKVSIPGADLKKAKRLEASPILNSQLYRQNQAMVASMISNPCSGFLDSFRLFVNSSQHEKQYMTPVIKRRRRRITSRSHYVSDDSDSSSSSSNLSAVSTESHEFKVKKRGRRNKSLKRKEDSSDDAHGTSSPTPSNSSRYSVSNISSDGAVNKSQLENKDSVNNSDSQIAQTIPKRLPVRKSRNVITISQDSDSYDEKISSDSDAEIPQSMKKTAYQKTNKPRTVGLPAAKYKQNDRSQDSMEDGSSSEGCKDKNDDDDYTGTTQKKKGQRRGRRGRVPKLNCCRIYFGKVDGKRGRGRPRKLWLEQMGRLILEKRGRGRPRKYWLDQVAQPFANPPHAHLRRSGEPFLQDGPCLDVAPKLPKCRECRMRAQHKTNFANIFCRFYAFRKLSYGKNGTIFSAGFSQLADATPADLKLWLPSKENPPADLDVDTSNFLLMHVGDQFCDLVQQEKEAGLLHFNEDQKECWKRVVQGVREMCDVCETTLFNVHWVCRKCGFVVCIDCYKGRKNGTAKEEEFPPRNHDEYLWLFCSNHQPHEQSKLMMTQIIASTVLWDVAKTMHEIRKKWNIKAHCKCSLSSEEPQEKPVFNGICKQLMNSVSKTFNVKKETVNNASNSQSSIKRQGKNCVNKLPQVLKHEENVPMYNLEVGGSPLRWLADVALNSSGKLQENQQVTNTEENIQDSSSKTVTLQPCTGDNLLKAEEKPTYNFSNLRQLIKPDGKNLNSSKSEPPKSLVSAIDEIIAHVIEQKTSQDSGSKDEKLLKHFSRRYPQPRNGHEPLPIRICTLTESRLLFPNVPHSWLCNGKLLLLKDPSHANNLKIFQEQWKRGQPVLVAGVSSKLDMSLWHPDGFSHDFGDIKNDLVNCKTGAILPDLPMRKFWEGFENFSKRMIDEDGKYMLLKLKDWPPGEDFSEMLPSRFQDLMKVLPLPQYTHRDGVLNLAGRLPECFVRPDLGPKMYNAYGSALYPTKGTTNLHLDISDAVNVMVYVGIPNDGKDEVHIQEALKAIDEGGCDSLMRKRVREKGVKPGALWHIFNARDADKIRDLLNKVAIERGEKLEAHHDPIHDQSWYLDEELRDRLYKEYGVEGYAIGQCLGDAVFIPAGAPHQVRNLHSCIKVAEDFVSPENIAHCFTLTQEFRQLSDTHTNHEDKLQIKNIIYHAVKDALGLLLAQIPSETVG